MRSRGSEGDRVAGVPHTDPPGPAPACVRPGMQRVPFFFLAEDKE